MEKEELVKYWVKAAELDFPSIDNMFEKGEYVWSLFIGHLVLEKILKAHYSGKIGKMPPKTHDLLKLANACGLVLDSEQIRILDKVNEFNIEARYPEEKFLFYKKCTSDFTLENINLIKGIYEWLKSRI
ncbi:MAG: HEPN domain-containing protein [bacterium]